MGKSHISRSNSLLLSSKQRCALQLFWLVPLASSSLVAAAVAVMLPVAAWAVATHPAANHMVAAAVAVDTQLEVEWAAVPVIHKEVASAGKIK